MANLTPEQLQQIRDYYSKPQMGGPLNVGGQIYQSDAQQGWGEDSTGASGPTQYVSYDASKTDPGMAYDKYGLDGNYAGQGQFLKDDWLKNLAIAVGGAAGMAFGAPMLMNGAGAGGLSVAADAYLPGALGADGALMGSAPLSGMEGYLAGAGAQGAYLPGALGVDGALMGTAPLAGLEGYLAPAVGGAVGGAAGAASSGGGAQAAVDAATKTALSSTGSSFLPASLSSLVPSGAQGWLGPLATLGGALLGSKGTQKETSQTNTMDPRLDPFYHGQGGLLSQAQGLLQKQAAPGGMPGYDQMGLLGQQMMSTPRVGNGFNKFTGR